MVRGKEVLNDGLVSQKLLLVHEYIVWSNIVICLLHLWDPCIIGYVLYYTDPVLGCLSLIEVLDNQTRF